MFYRWQDEDLLLHCHLQPGAKRSEFAGEHGGRLKLRIAAPAVEGKANAALIAFLAKAFGVAKRAVAIEAGELGRQKTLRIAAPQRLPVELGIPSPDAGRETEDA